MSHLIDLGGIVRVEERQGHGDQHWPPRWKRTERQAVLQNQIPTLLQVEDTVYTRKIVHPRIVRAHTPHAVDPSHRGFKNVLAKALRIIFEPPV